MLILLFFIFVALYILASLFIDECEHDVFKCITQMCTVVGTAITILVFIGVCATYSETLVIDDIIAMYTEENENIESQIDVIVREYMNYERNSFTELKGDSSITLVSLYPELKTDELVKTQINTYQANNEKLKELKEKKIKANIYSWWLFFGN